MEGLLLKLKLQYFGHLMLRAHSLEKTLISSVNPSREPPSSRVGSEGAVMGLHVALGEGFTLGL